MKKLYTLVAFALLASMVLTACGAPPAPAEPAAPSAEYVPAGHDTLSAPAPGQ